MPEFGKKSLKLLADVEPDLVRVLSEAIKYMDFTVTCGHRTLDEQQALYAQGRTRAGPIVTKCDGIDKKSMHQGMPSRAVDIAPWPIDWNDTQRFIYLAGHVMGIAGMMDIPLRCGVDFNKNYNLNDDRFDDLPHFELD